MNAVAARSQAPAWERGHEAIVMAAERSQVVIYDDDQTGWEFPKQVAANLKWDKKQLQLRKPPPEKKSDETN